MGPSARTLGAAQVPAEALAAARTYLAGRQSPDGGFCTYRSNWLDEPNLFDTWHAVAAFGALGVAVPDAQRCGAFVAAQAVTARAHALYYRVRSLHALRQPDPRAKAVRDAAQALFGQLPAIERGPSLAGRLDAIRHVLWLHGRLRHPFEGPVASPASDREGPPSRQSTVHRHPCAAIVDTLLSLEDEHGGFPSPPDLLSTHAAWAVLRLCGSAPSPRTAAFVARLTVPAFGFRLTPDSLSPHLEITCAGVQCCRWAGRAIEHAADATRFILACQDGRGGFARAPGALADIACTHLAIMGLSQLCGPFGRDTEA